MAESCPACSFVVDDTGVAAGGLLRCAKCGTRFQKPKPVEAKQWSSRDADRELGIHPALAKKYGKLNSIPEGAPVVEPQAPAPEPPKATRVLAPPAGEVLES